MSGFDRSTWQRRALAIARNTPYIGPRLLLQAMRRRLRPDAVTLAKVRNFILANHESDQRAVQVRSLPYILNLDTVNACNLKCPFCATGTSQLDRKRTRLSRERAKAVIDRVREHTLMVRFHNWGEPFLNKEIFELIRHARDAGLHTMASSNLSLDIDGLAEKIVDSGLDHIHVSIDGLQQQTLETYRRRAKIELVLHNIREIVALKRRRGIDTPRLELAFLVFRHNEHEVGRLDAMRRELGVDSFTASNAFIYHDSFVPRDPAYAPSQAIWRGHCHYLYSELMVESDGRISPCCTNTSDRFDVGDIDELDDLHAFWNKPVFQAMRAKGRGAVGRDHQGEEMETLCDYCSYIATDDAPGTSRLSPLPPALVAAGEQFHHGLDEINRRV